MIKGVIRLAAILAVLFSTGASFAPFSAQAAGLPIPTGLNVTPDDHNAIVRWNFDPNKPTAPLPPGVAGYKITWGPADQPDAFSKVTEERIIQLQPLVNGQPYVARVQSVNSYGQLSAASASISFTGDPARVDALRAQMNGFFDDFNLPAGFPDETRWNSAYSHCNAPNASSFFINDQFHAHNTVFSSNCDRGQSISRPRALLDFSDGGTRTIVFDFDGAFRRNQWYLDLVPRLMDISGQVNIEGLTAPADPADGLRFHQSEQTASIGLFDTNGTVKVLTTTDNVHVPKLDAAGVKQVSNVRRHWEIRLSRTSAEVRIDGKLVLATAPGAFQLKQQRYYLLWNMFGYNSNKANVPISLGHWDNFGFDAPAGTTNTIVTHNYRLVSNSSDFIKAFGANAPANVTLNIPDPVDSAVASRLMFTLQMDNYDTYSWAPTDRVTVNGTALAIPRPASNAIPAIPLSVMVSTISPYTIAIPLPNGILHQGTNQISLNTIASTFHSLHAEIDFARDGAPAYTQPATAQPSAAAPTIAPIGPNAIFTQIGTTRIDPGISDLTRVTVFNKIVSGIVPLKLEVHNDIAMQGVGSSSGVRQVDIVVDGGVVLSQRTDEAAPAPAVYLSYNLDTRSFANGTHELYVRAYDARCTPSIADYLGAGSRSGTYYPLHITIQNSAVASVAAAPVAASYRVLLPIAGNGKRPSSTCVLTPATAAQGSQAAAQFAPATPADARREEQSLFVCEW
ncbi:MAG: fibronectin type III domain-containing protein [Kouleothrix sp.]